MIPGSANPLLLASAAAEDGAYAISRSLRFNNSDSAYLSRTPASAGNRKTWTWAGWVKRSKLDGFQPLFAVSGSDAFRFESSPADALGLNNYGTSVLATSGVFRDPSAWYHVVLAVDTTQSSNRVKIYVNGELQVQGDPYALNEDTPFNSTVVHEIGRNPSATTRLFDGYLADVHFIDGQALDPTSFGEFDTNGVWQPKEYTGDFTIGPVYSNNSSGGAFSSTGSWAQAFDGNLSTGPFTYSSTSNTLTLPPEVTWSSQIRVYALRYNGIFEINGTDVSSGIGTSAAWHDLTSTLGSSGTLSTIEIGDVGTNYVKLSAVELDGQILIDSSGLNSFHLPFSDNSSAAALGTDTSGNGNTWTVNNISVTAGAGNDSLVDSPTNGTQTDTGAGGEVVGNYCTWNPLANSFPSQPASWSTATLSEGNLKWVSPASDRAGNTGTIAVSSGKFYWELTMDSVSSSGSLTLGVAKSNSTYGSTGQIAYISNSGEIYVEGVLDSTGASFETGDVIGVAYNANDDQITFYKNNTSQGTISLSGFAGYPVSPLILDRSSLGFTVTANFGQRPFAYTAPSGYKALCTTNLDDPVVAKPSEVMDVKLYTGNGSTQTISGLGFSPDLVWVKQRDVTRNHQLVDTVRGATLDLRSNTSGAETTTATGLTAFTADGFSLGADAGYNVSSGTYVAWTWDAGSSTVTNTQGSITSQVRANASAGFSVVKYNLSGTSAQTIGHGLNSSLGLLITKCVSTTNGWAIWHSALSDTQGIAFTSAAASTVTWWDQSNMTSSVFAHKAGTTSPSSGADVIAYCFAPVAGYSSFGSYTGNGSTDGPFVYTGFRPRFILIKATDSTPSWRIFDTERDSYNLVTRKLYPNLSNAELNNGVENFDILSNGFKHRDADSGVNGSGNVYIYAAFAEHPFQTARAR